MKVLAILVAVAVLAGSNEPRVSLGGPASVAGEGPNAFSYPAPVLDAQERRAFSVGNAFFKDNWVAAPSTTAGRDGLGPLFNARSCSGCHLRDGRGRPARADELGGTGLLVRVGSAAPNGGEDRPHPRWGSQISDFALPGLAPEAVVRVEERGVPGTYGDGSPFSLIEPILWFETEAGRERPPQVSGARVAPHMVGLGLLEAVPAETLEALADPEDADGDGISGRVHRVLDLRSGELVPGRFGWKATQPTVEQQVAGAFVGDLGITSSLFPSEDRGAEQLAFDRERSGGDPELSDHKLARVTFYSQVLGVPNQRDVGSASVRAGEALFDRFGCASCHTPQLATGPTAVVDAYANQTFRPYTDLLLHDLGPALADGKRDGDALPSEWRTPPLWGIGLFEEVSGHTRFLHDGRARGLAEAILWHGGEAGPSRELFRNAAQGEREELLEFLRSL